MARLTYKRRKKLPKRQFALPSKRAYPIDTRQRAINALGKAKRFASPAQRKVIKRAVCKRYPDLPSCKKKK